MQSSTIFGRMNSRRFFLLLVALAMAACTTAPAKPQGTDPELPPPSEGLAQLVFLRADASKLYLLRRAPVYLEDQKIGDIPYGGWLQREVRPAQYRLTVKNWGSPGRCEVVIDAKSDTTYYLQIEPRGQNIGAFIAGSFAGTVAGANDWVALAMGMTLQAAVSYLQACGGLFRLYPVDEASARAKLAFLEPATD